MATTKKVKNVAAEPEEKEPIKSTGVILPRETLELLWDVSVARRKKHGGRASVSAVLRDLIEKHRGELERELQA